MDFLTDDSIMYGGKGSKTFTMLILSLLYLTISIILWWVYYFYFKDRRKIGETDDETKKEGILWGQVGIFISFSIVALLVFLSGYYQDPNEQTPWYRRYILVPICFLSIGAQSGLILSMATPDDLNKLKKNVKDRI